MRLSLPCIELLLSFSRPEFIKDEFSSILWLILLRDDFFYLRASLLEKLNKMRGFFTLWSLTVIFYLICLMFVKFYLHNSIETIQYS